MNGKKASRMTDKTPDRSRDVRASQARRKKIGDQLKKLYDDVATEPVPDEFLKLLEEADKADDDAHTDEDDPSDLSGSSR